MRIYILHGQRMRGKSAVEVGVLRTNFGDFWTYDGRTVSLVGVSCVVIMMLFLGDEEVDWLFERGDDWIVVDVAHVGDHGFGRGPLFLGKGHDAGAVLRTDVVALAIELGWVVNREEHLEQRFEGDDGWVKLDFNHLGVARGAAAHRLVGWVRVVAAGVGREGGLNAVDLFVGAFDAPEASAANDHSFHNTSSEAVAFEGLISPLNKAKPSMPNHHKRLCVLEHHGS